MKTRINPKKSTLIVGIFINYSDCLITTAVNCFTSFFSGFVIFTYLGFMSHKQHKPISSVATEGELYNTLIPQL